ARADQLRRLAAAAQKNVIRGIGDATQCAGRVTRTGECAARCVDALHNGGSAERSATAPPDDLKFKPGNVICCRARRIADNLSRHGAAVGVLPGGAGIMTSDGLASGDQRRDRLAKGPRELAIAARLALVNLCAFGM